MDGAKFIKLAVFGAVCAYLIFSLTGEAGTNSDLPPSRASERQEIRTVFFDKTYFNKSHKEHLVRDYFDLRPDEWRVVGTQSAGADLTWVFGPHQITYPSRPGRQMFNHIRNLQEIVEKDRMYLNLQAADRLPGAELQSADFTPKTFIFDTGRSEFSKHELEFMRGVKSGVWILKPNNRFGGEGIQVFRNVEKCKSLIRSLKGAAKPGRVVVQRYIENPLLVEKKKFDIRSYILVANSQPYLAYYHDGFIRRTLFEYNLDSAGDDDSFVHLTNVEAQKKHPRYEELKDATLMSTEEFYAHHTGNN